MRQEIEIEFKNLLTREEFETLKKAFQIPESAFLFQENHYFDTPEFALKDNSAALRIRMKSGTYTLTLKQPHREGLLETHQPLTKEEAFSLIEGKSFITGAIAEIVKNLNVRPEEIRCFGTLRTKRAQIDYKSGVLVLDHSYYLQTDDYEIEYESGNAAIGEQTFKELLRTFNIPIRKTENKIKRYYLKRYGLRDSDEHSPS